MTLCPACDKPVDPLRSRFVGVRDGKIVAYCSAACAEGARSSGSEAPPGRAASPATGVPARVATPAAGIPARTQTPATGVPAGPPRPVTPAPGVPINLDSGPVIEIIHEPASGVMTSARDARSEPRARHPDEIPIAAFWSADQEKAEAGDAARPGAPGAAPGPAAAAREASSPETAREAASDGAGTATAVREASARPPSDADLDLEAAPRRSRLPVWLLILALAGGGGFLLYRYLVHGGIAAATQLPSVPAPSPAPAVHAESPRSLRAAGPSAAAELQDLVDAAGAVERARQALRRELTATSPRVQRLAAAALARTEDPGACAQIALQIGVGGGRDQPPRLAEAAEAQDASPLTSDIARLDLAYALARGGDRRGSEVLSAALRAPRGEARDEAARLLALLGDHRAVPHLLDLLAVEQRRLGAAEHLAHLGEAHALKVLDLVRADPRASAGDKARATVALGFAGRGDVAAALRDMLGDPHFNAFAAAALAELGDRSARPVLARQLASPPLRVLAARALRRLEPRIDPRPLLPPLLEVVRAGRDIDRIPAAEAILLLAGPQRWSAYD